MKRYIMMLFLMSGIASSFLSAQLTERQFSKDKLPNKGWIYVIDGEPIWAVITKDNGESLSYVDNKGKKKNINYSSIEKVKAGNYPVTLTKKGRYHKDRGFFLHGFISVNIAGSDAYTISWQSTFGMRINKRFTAGIGFAFDGYEDDLGNAFFNEQFLFGSLYSYGRFNLTNTRARLYLYSRLGYGIGLDGSAWEESFSDGINVQPGIGVTFASRRTFRLVMELGMAIQNVNGQLEIRDPITNRNIISDYKNSLRRPLLKIGLEF